jgi:hypothetical protein
LQRPHIFIGSQRTNGSKGEEQEKQNESFHYLEIGCRPAIGWEERKLKRAFLVQMARG